MRKRKEEKGSEALLSKLIVDCVTDRSVIVICTTVTMSGNVIFYKVVL